MKKSNYTLLASGVALVLSNTALHATVSVDDALITNSKISSEWTDCDGSNLIAGTTGDFDEEHLATEGCAFRETPATAGEIYKLTCGITSNKYASITLAFHNDNGEELATQTTEVFEAVEGGAYSVELLAPANTATAAVGIYGLEGTGFQDCTLQLSTPVTEPQTVRLSAQLGSMKMKMALEITVKQSFNQP